MSRLVVSLSPPGFDTIRLLQSVQSSCQFSHYLHLVGDPTVRVTNWLAAGQSVFVVDMAYSAEDWICDAVGVSPGSVALLWTLDPYRQLVRSEWDHRSPITNDYGAIARIHQKLVERGYRVVICDEDELVRRPSDYLATLGELLGLKRPLGSTYWTRTDPSETKSKFHDPRSEKEIANSYYSFDTEYIARPNPEPTFEHFAPPIRGMVRQVYSANIRWYAELKEYAVGLPKT